MAKKSTLGRLFRSLMVSSLLLLVTFVLGVAVLSFRPFVVRNAGHESIRVLAVAMSPKGLVPLWAPSSSEFQKAIAPGARETFRYNFDGLSLCGVMVLVDGEEPRLLWTPSTPEDRRCPVIDPNTGERFCCMPIGWSEVLVAPPLSKLERAPRALAVLAGLRDYPEPADQD